MDFCRELLKDHGPWGIGGGALGGTGGGYTLGVLSDEEVMHLLNTLYHHKVRLIDLAPIYGFGEAEKRVGRYFQKFPERRKEYVVITKGGVDWNEKKRVDLSNHPATIRKMVYESLERLQTDWIDLYMIHWPDPRHSLEAAYEVLLEFQRKGMIGALGLSNPQLSDLDNIQKLYPQTLSALQYEYHFFREDVAASVMSQEKKMDQEKPWMHFFWGAFGKGIFQTSRDYHASDARPQAYWWKKDKIQRRWKEKFLQSISPTLWNEYHWTLSDLAALWTLCFSAHEQHHGHSLFGTHRLEQWKRLFFLYEEVMHTKQFKDDWKACREWIKKQKHIFYHQYLSMMKESGLHESDPLLSFFFSSNLDRKE